MALGRQGSNGFLKGYNSKFYHPRGYTPGKWGSETTIPDKINRTYLNWDYEQTPYYDPVAEKGASDDFDAAAIFYGPSSHHGTVVNHAFADGSVRGISVDIDAAAYMFLITRSGGDPADSESLPY